ncbi:hypothetical protein QQP08_019479 [Theobroma cacao]|nr:hypothetical protein QQP08_019479 [Theobroma cacao]
MKAVTSRRPGRSIKDQLRERKRSRTLEQPKRKQQSCKQALTITLSPGSVKTISDALRAASVASSTAIPMSAFLRAGASFTPSPVMPHM